MSDFYGTAAGFQAYHLARGRHTTQHHTDDVTVALLVASEWLDGAFGYRWPGYKVGNRQQQTRDWPRSWVQDREGYPVDATTVPTEIENATYEAALRHLQDETVLQSDYTPNRYKRVSIEGSVSAEYLSLSAEQVQVQFPVIGQILAPLLEGNGGVSSISSGVVRA
jgi:hypothetical protein